MRVGIERKSKEGERISAHEKEGGGYMEYSVLASETKPRTKVI